MSDKKFVDFLFKRDGKTSALWWHILAWMGIAYTGMCICVVVAIAIFELGPPFILGTAVAVGIMMGCTSHERDAELNEEKAAE